MAGPGKKEVMVPDAGRGALRAVPRIIRRRALIAMAGTVLCAWPRALHAQTPPRSVRVGFLGFGASAGTMKRVEILRAALRDHGYVEGKNLVIEFRWARTTEELNAAAVELARMRVDVIFAMSSTETEAARRATTTIPIVFATHADPEGVGHVASLAHPGGNATGLADIQSEITPKRLEILKAAVPQVTRVGVLLSEQAPSFRPFLKAAEETARRLGLHLIPVRVNTVAEFEGAFARMALDRAGAVLVHAASLTTRHDPVLLAETAQKHRLPTMFGSRDNVIAGGLMSYAPDHLDLTRRTAVYIDKIARGTKPADLPVEQASKYELVVNRKTANALGLTIPPSILERADEIIG